MRNLKRALSLALASVMLLGMMVVGSSAAFVDADEIVNKEAVEITAGLGLFKGKDDGKFDPKGNVTRAEMATVITKMLYGSEINADQFKGTGKFSDTAGWYEGYINLCANLGIVKGYGDGTFGPNGQVTTAEAVTMIINALKVDAGNGDWPLTVMSKAEEMKLFEELAVKPGTNIALTRDQLASIVLEGVKYSPKGIDGYTIPGSDIVFKDLGDAVVAAGKENVGKIKEVVGEDALYRTVFDVKEAEGFIVSNQATSDDEYTTIAGVDGDGKSWTLKLNIETGLDMIGHYATAYYAEKWESKAKPGTAYCIVDEADYFTLDEVADSIKEFKAAFESNKYDVANTVNYVNGHYYESKIAGSDLGYVKGEYAAPGTYVVFEGKVVGYLAPATVYADQVAKVVTTAGKESIRLTSGMALDNNDILDEVVEYDGIAKDDVITYVIAQDMYVLTKANVVEGKIAKAFTKEYKNYITANGIDYVVPGSMDRDGLSADFAYLRSDIDFTSTYEIYTTATGKVIAFSEVDGTTELGDIVYVLGYYSVFGTDAYGNDTYSWFAQGIDTEGKEVSILVGVNYDGKKDNLGVCWVGDAEKAKDDNYDAKFDASVKQIEEPSFLVFDDHDEKDEKKAGVKTFEGTDTAKTADKASVYTGSVTFAAGLGFDSKTVTVTTDTVADVAFLADTTKFIVYDGNLAEKLDTAVVTGSFKSDINESASTTFNVILSADKNANVTLEAVFVADELSVSAEDVIYVSATQFANKAEVEDAYEVDAYFVTAGKAKPIKVDDIRSAGFYQYKYNATEDLYEDLTRIGEDSQYKYAELLKNVYGGTKLVTDAIVGADATNAFVIDTRSEETIDDSSVAKITDLEELADTLNLDYKVILDVVLDDYDQKTVVAIMVLSVCDTEDHINTINVDSENVWGTHTWYCPECGDTNSEACSVYEYAEVTADEHTEICVCGAEQTVAHTYDAETGKCDCGAEKPAPAPAE